MDVSALAVNHFDYFLQWLCVFNSPFHKCTTHDHKLVYDFAIIISFIIQKFSS